MSIHFQTSRKQFAAISLDGSNQSGAEVVSALCMEG
jgi:hypothetical protein